jgi:hypothetical protein
MARRMKIFLTGKSGHHQISSKRNGLRCASNYSQGLVVLHPPCCLSLCLTSQPADTFAAMFFRVGSLRLFVLLYCTIAATAFTVTLRDVANKALEEIQKDPLAAAKAAENGVNNVFRGWSCDQINTLVKEVTCTDPIFKPWPVVLKKTFVNSSA